MHPDVLHEPEFVRGQLSRDPIPEFGRGEALRRLARAARENPYPHCPRCRRAMLAVARTHFACPGGHVTLTLPARRRGLWRWVLLAFSQRHAGVST